MPRPPDAIIPLWPGEAPGLLSPAPFDLTLDRAKDHGSADRAHTSIRTPHLAVFRATKPSGAAMLLIPGGAYSYVVVDKEGFELGRWLSYRGITAFILFYRLPGQGWLLGPDTPLTDAQRAMRLIRANAAADGLDAQRIGALGFSAGGHLAATLATRHDQRPPLIRDSIDTHSARPALVATIYPVLSMEEGLVHIGSRTALLGSNPPPGLRARHSPDQNLGPDTPPWFLLHAADDSTVPIASTVQMISALRTNGTKVQAHLFEQGGHGFGWGERTKGLPVHHWPNLFLKWATLNGL